MHNFWQNLPKPFTVLAPMDGVTDYVFRQMVLTLGRPDVFFTEFTPVDGILSKGKSHVVNNLKFSKKEQPVVAQLWGHDPKHFHEAAKLVSSMRFAGIDINMGCPDKTTIKYGACAALINNPKLAEKIIKATREGANGLPISVKTRIGFNEEVIDKWITFLLKQNLPVLTVHLRTAKEMSHPPAHWEFMSRILELRNKISPSTLIIGNGDLFTLDEVRKAHDEHGADGYMVGRGILSNPWMFNNSVNPDEISVKTKLDTYLHHVRLYNKTWGKNKNSAVVRKFCKAYIHGFPDASNMREKLAVTKNIEELEAALITLRNNLQA
ncbi:tRNA-dihydrouridine synthase [Patescibacteria group bacterium]|nr:tRNA-dihydrouridine synthase [Patescibacteria group bacterium]